MKIKNILLFTFINLILWCLISLKYYFISGFYTDALGMAFTIIALPGHLFLYALLMFLVLSLLSLTVPRAVKTAAVLLATFFTLLFLIDVFVYSQYRFHISLAMLELFFGPAGREIFVFPASAYAMTAGFLAVLIFIQFLILKLSTAFNITKKVTASIIVICLSAVILYNGLYAWGRFNAIPSVTYQISYFLWPVPISLNKMLKKMGFKPKEKSLNIKDNGLLNYPLSPMQCAGDKTPNILIILVDALRGDFFTRDIMPNTYNYYKDTKTATYFTRHISGGNATQAAVFSLFYSLPSTYWNATVAEHRAPVFMDELQKRGYDMEIFSSGRLNSPEFNKNIFTNIPNLRLSSEGTAKYERDNDMQADFIEALKANDTAKPFFGFLFYDSLHGYSYPPDFPQEFTPAKEVNYLTLTPSTDPAPYLNRLKNSARFVDSKLKDLFETLNTLGYADNTIIILTGDHGQEMNDTGGNFWGHNSNFARYQTHVPLIVFWPGKEGGAVSYRTSHYDIIPTLMQDVFKCSNDLGDYALGYNLFDKTPRPYILSTSYTDKAIIAGNKITVINQYGALDSYDENYQETETVEGALMSEALKSISKYYR